MDGEHEVEYLGEKICLPEFWSAALIKRFNEMQWQRNLLEKDWEVGFKQTCPRKPLSLEQKINNFIKRAMSDARIEAAKKIAKDDWPDEEYY